MKNLIALLTLLLLATPAFADYGYELNHHRGDRTLGLEILQDLAGIPHKRLNELGCQYDNANRGLCSIEHRRKKIAHNNIHHYKGSLHYVKSAILNDITNRKNRIHNLRCDSRNYGSEVCNYEESVVNELSGVFLSDINRAIFRSRAHKDRIHRDRIRRDRLKRERIKRERRERARRDRIKRERRDRVKRIPRKGKDRVKRPNPRRDRVKRPNPRRGNKRRPVNPRRKRRG